MADQILVLAVLVLALAFFLWGRWRYDLVALGALLALTIPGVIEPADAFAGLGHPAVVTVAAVLVISRTLEQSGLVGVAANWVGAIADRPALVIPALTAMIALVSGFMNNVAALALLMPVAIRLAREADQPPSRFLMPIAFGSLLGGLITLIGTPSNIIIGTFRADADAEAFRMFDFAPVGAVIAVAGVVFIGLVGWRLVPARGKGAEAGEMFEIQDYLSELEVPEGSELVGQRLSAITDGSEVAVVGLVRNGERIQVPSALEVVRAGDRLIVETDSESLGELVEQFDLLINADESSEGKSDVGLEDLSLLEAVVAPGSRLAGRTASSLRLPRRHGVNLLAVSRRDESLRDRPSHVVLGPGDVILLQGSEEAIADAVDSLGCLPLAERSLSIGRPRRLLLAGSIFALGLTLTATGVLEVQVALTATAVAMVLAGLIRLDDAYQAIDWPILILIAAMLPVGGALETTGGAETIAGLLERLGGGLDQVMVVGLIILVAMLLSNIVSNAAAAVVMAPIAIQLAGTQGASIDPFLMAVAVGAALPLLTPIGHQSNTLIMGPGGYRFGDYWRLGLPISVLVVVLAPPVILWAWPLGV